MQPNGVEAYSSFLNYEIAENNHISFCWYIIIFFVQALLEDTFSDQFL